MLHRFWGIMNVGSCCHCYIIICVLDNNTEYRNLSVFFFFFFLNRTSDLYDVLSSTNIHGVNALDNSFPDPHHTVMLR